MADKTMAEILANVLGAQLEVVTLADVEPERVAWLWPGRIPAGKLVGLTGDPSMGKSTLALTFAAAITTGGTWPDGSRVDAPGDVVLLSAEDGLADTVRPRLDAAGADVTRVHAVQGVKSANLFGNDEPATLAPPTLGDVAALTALVKRVGARLLIVDVLMAYMPGKTDAHKDQDSRRVLSPLAAMADETGCTVLCLRHMNKSKGVDPMYRGGGSIGITGAFRYEMLAAVDPADPEVRVLATVKSNLGPAPESLRYRLADTGAGVAAVEWLGTDSRDARALLEFAAEDEAGSTVDGWLIEYLKDGPKKATDLYRDVDAAGHSKDQAKRAKKRLGITATKTGDAWWWAMPEGSTPTDESAEDPRARSLAPLLPSCSDGVDPAPLTLKGAREQGSESPGNVIPLEGLPGDVGPNTPGNTDRVAAALKVARG